MGRIVRAVESRAEMVLGRIDPKPLGYFNGPHRYVPIPVRSGFSTDPKFGGACKLVPCYHASAM